MIIFTKLRYANFLATGAAGNEIILNQHPTTLISALNGCGKSAILDAIVFALFGKPHRDVNKNQLINSINAKNCLVELWFSVDGQEYLIRRGIRPNIFEIFKNSVLIDQEAATRDYQKFLEQHILKTNVKAFTQSVILGSASFTPFMQMRPGERREIIEDFLDIKIFGVMHQILKEEIYSTKDSLTRIENKFAVSKTQIAGQKNLIDKLVNVNEQAEVIARAKIDALETVINGHKTHIINNTLRVRELESRQDPMQEVAKKIELLRDKIQARTHHIAVHTKTIDFLNNTEECPSCKQEIEEHHKKPVLHKINSECEKLRTDIESMTSEYDDALLVYESFVERAKEIRTINDSTRDIEKSINIAEKNIQTLEDEIMTKTVSDVMIEKLKLKQMVDDIVAVIDTKTSLSDTRCLQDRAYDILKDTGVKTNIIREYLPVINKMINQYLATMEFFVDFNLDESFAEVIRSRFRDEFTYASFSEGEKKRLDIAILFAWRQIAKMKNSVNCNILFLDELLDGSLDEPGLDAVFQIIEQESKHSNVFVISHNDFFKDKFSNVINIAKVGDFSVVQ